LGKDYDGGYLANKQDITAALLLVSLGVGTDISFERDFTDLNNCDVKACDKELHNIDAATLEYFTGGRQLCQQEITAGTLYSMLATDHIFLKCDIEGAEYSILDELIQHAHKFTGMVIEFHDCNRPENYNSLLNFIAKIPLRLVHTHVNNYFYYKTDTGPIPDIFELSFSAGLNVLYKTQLRLPHELDMPNNPQDGEFELKF
jgi:hypothetical protein